MDLQLTDQRFLVCGASSGFGKAVAESLLQEGARCILVARRIEMLRASFSDYEEQVEFVMGDLTSPKTVGRVVEKVRKGPFHGALINAGGPPVGTPTETSMEDWDEAYQLVMRWKIDLMLKLVPILKENRYGRLLCIESKSVKQPVPALVLSNAFRAGVVGFVKTLAGEVAGDGITVNVLAPGAHETPAIERLIKKKSEQNQITIAAARIATEKSIPVGRMGRAEEIASLAAWLLSTHSSYVTGQTISHDGGSISGLFG
ncbi:MAG: SDR family oxidoreductase [Balneolaceae bacterium]